MKKSRILSFILFISILLFMLSGFSGYGTVNLESENKVLNKKLTYEKTLDIGSEFHTYGRLDYLYGGVVNDSVVINVHQNLAEKAMTLAFYIPITRTEEVALPYDKSTTIKLTKVDKTKGTADITLTTTKSK